MRLAYAVSSFAPRLRRLPESRAINERISGELAYRAAEREGGADVGTASVASFVRAEPALN